MNTQSHNRQSSTRISVLAEDLAIQIIRGEFPPGTRLPSVRALSAQLDAPVSTIQRVLIWLESHGLVQARHGSGVEVGDPRWADIALLPLWLRAYPDEPEIAAKILGDFLALRRSLASELFRQVKAEIDPVTGRALSRIIERFAAAVSGPAVTAMQLAAIDFEFAKVLIERLDQRAYFYLYGILERTVRQNPRLAAAIYAEPDRNLAGLRAALEGLSDQGQAADDLARTIVSVLEAADAAAVARFCESTGDI